MGIRRGRLSELVISSEPWQIFLVFLGVIIIYKIIPDDQELFKVIATILLSITIFGWLLIIGLNLNDNLPEDEQKSDTLFILNGFYGILFVSVSSLFEDITINEEIAPYLIILAIYFGFSFFYMIYFASTLFTYNQERFLDKEKLSAEAIFILFIVFIVGILILQSRIKTFFT